MKVVNFKLYGSDFESLSRKCIPLVRTLKFNLCSRFHNFTSTVIVPTLEELDPSLDEKLMMVSLDLWLFLFGLFFFFF